MSNDHPPSAPPVPPYGTPESQQPGSASGSSSGPFGSAGQPGGPTSPPWNTARPAGRSYRYATDDFFSWIRGTGLTRVDEGRWAAGVAGGIARRWDVDPVLVRGVFVAASLFGGIGIVAYGLGWLLLPQESDGRIHLQRAVHGDLSLGFVGSVLLTLLGIGGGGSGHVWWGFGFPGGLLVTFLIVGAIWWFAKRHGNGPGPTYAAPMPPASAGPWSREADPGFAPYTPVQDAPAAHPRGADWTTTTYGPGPEYRPLPPSRPPSTSKSKSAKRRRREATRPSKRLVFFTLGLALLAAAAILLAGLGRHWSTPAGLSAAAVALLVIACGVLVSGLIGRRAAGLAGIGVLLAFGTVLGVGAQHSGIQAGQESSFAGSRVWRPVTAGDAARQFNLGFGDSTLDLTRPAITAGATGAVPLAVQARLGAGNLVVVLPDDTPAEVQVQMVAGQITNPDGKTLQINGHQHDTTVDTVRTGGSATTAPLMVVTVQQGFGQLELRTASAQKQLDQPTPSASGAPASTPTVPVTPSPAAKAAASK